METKASSQIPAIAHLEGKRKPIYQPVLSNFEPNCIVDINRQDDRIRFSILFQKVFDCGGSQNREQTVSMNDLGIFDPEFVVYLLSTYRRQLKELLLFPGMQPVVQQKLEILDAYEKSLESQLLPNSKSSLLSAVAKVGPEDGRQKLADTVMRSPGPKETNKPQTKSSLDGVLANNRSKSVENKVAIPATKELEPPIPLRRPVKVYKDQPLIPLHKLAGLRNKLKEKFGFTVLTSGSYENNSRQQYADIFERLVDHTLAKTKVFMKFLEELEDLADSLQNKIRKKKTSMNVREFQDKLSKLSEFGKKRFQTVQGDMTNKGVASHSAPNK